jgi:hypothetical protein
MYDSKDGHAEEESDRNVSARIENVSRIDSNEGGEVCIYVHTCMYFMCGFIYVYI